MLRAYGVSERGPVRSVNEDRFAIDERLSLLVVADGMGGHQAGEVAAQLAVDAILDAVGDSKEPRTWPFGFDRRMSEAGNILRTAVHAANHRVVAAARVNGNYAGMGTTVVAAIVRGDRLSVAHVGDSRLYISSAQGLALVTRDDSWIASVLAKEPTADLAELRSHPMRNALTNVVGRGTPPEVHVSEHVLHGVAWLALTTDGVHGTLGEQLMAGLFRHAAQAAALAKELVGQALVHGSRDNCTAVVARYEPKNYSV